MFVRESVMVGGQPLTMETGRLAKQANGSVLVTYGESVVLVAAAFWIFQFAFAATAATFPDAGQAEPASAKRCTDRVSPQVAAPTGLVRAQGVVTAPGCHWSFRITGHTRVEQPHQAERTCLS